MFKWACSRELIPARIYQGLLSVDGLRRGKSDARETEPVRPVADHLVEGVLKHVSRQVGGLIRLQLATGMRPGEAIIMRGCDIDTTGAVWSYRPHRHKTGYRGHERIVYLGPKARAIVAEFLKPDTQAFMFSPIDVERERRAAASSRRRTPLSCGNVPGSNRERKPARKPKDRYTVGSYRRAIARACDAAFPPDDSLARRRVAKEPAGKARRWETDSEWRARLGEKKWAKVREWQDAHRWHPHQLRHNAATRLRKQFGVHQPPEHRHPHRRHQHHQEARE